MVNTRIATRVKLKNATNPRIKVSGYRTRCFGIFVPFLPYMVKQTKANPPGLNQSKIPSLTGRRLRSKRENVWRFK